MDYNLPLNIVLVGDPEVGKSTLIAKCHQFNPTSENGGFFTRDFKIPSSYKPTSLSSYLTSIYQNKGDHSMMYSVFRANIIDTGGARRYDHVRPLAYIDAEVFLVCFDICNRQSFLNVSSRWLPEIKKYESQVPVILVGTKADLKSRRQVTEAEICDACKTLNICWRNYVETKSYDKDGMVCALFDKAVELAFTYCKDHLKSRFKKTKDKYSEQIFDVTNLEKASDPPECARGSSTLSSDWQVTLDSKRAADVILKFQDESPEIHAHKFVLALASTTFRKLFKTFDNICGAIIRGRNAGQTSLPTDETECCNFCVNSETSTVQELYSSFLEKTPFFQIHCAHCSGQKVGDKKEGKSREAFSIQITFKTFIKRPVFLSVLEWMYTGRLDISDEPEQSFIEDLEKILLELEIQALRFSLLRILQHRRRLNIPLLPSARGHNQGQHGNIPIPPPLPPLLPSARDHNLGQHGNIPIPTPPLPPSARGHNLGQNGNIPVPPPLPPLLPSARGHNLRQHGNIPIPPPPILPSARGRNLGQHCNIPVPPPLLPSARGLNLGQHCNIPVPPPLPPLLPSARGHNLGQHCNIPIPPPLPLPPSARGHNLGQHGNIPIPPQPPSARGHNLGQHGNIPIPPPPLPPSAYNIPLPPPLLPSARGHNLGQHGNIPLPPPIPPLPPSAYNIPLPPPLPPSARGHNLGQHGNIPTPPPIPPPARRNNLGQHSNIPLGPPPPRPPVSKRDLANAYKEMWENAHSLLIDKDLQPDLVLIVDNMPIHVHRVVLISRSPMMAAMLDGNFKERDLNTVKLPSVPLEHFRTLLEFMYSDACALNETNIKDIMKLADRFDVPSLLKRCEEYMIYTLLDNTFTKDFVEMGRDLVMDTIYFSETFNAQLLHKWCLHFVATNYDLFEQEEDFKAIWSQNAEYMESNRWPSRNYIQVLKQYKASRSKINEILRKRRSNTTKCACCIM